MQDEESRSREPRRLFPQSRAHLENVTLRECSFGFSAAHVGVLDYQQVTATSCSFVDSMVVKGVSSIGLLALVQPADPPVVQFWYSTEYDAFLSKWPKQ